VDGKAARDATKFGDAGALMNSLWLEISKGKDATLHFYRDPKYFGCGTYSDVAGNQWTVSGIKEGYVQVQPYSLRGWRNSTAEWSDGPEPYSPIWLPYEVEVVVIKEETGDG
jgi:hypothetical protein